MYTLFTFILDKFISRYFAYLPKQNVRSQVINLVYVKMQICNLALTNLGREFVEHTIYIFSSLNQIFFHTYKVRDRTCVKYLSRVPLQYNQLL